MADSLIVTVELVSDHWEITAQVNPHDTLPAHIFIFENTGDIVLGKYVGVASLDELKRIQEWTYTAIPVFGNRFVRTNQAKIQMPLNVVPQTIVDNILSSTKALKTQLQAASSTTTVYPI